MVLGTSAIWVQGLSGEIAWYVGQATWVKELLTEVIFEMPQMPGGKPPTLMVPLMAATTWTAWDLSPEDSWSIAWNSTAVQLNDRSGHAGPSDCDAREFSKKTSFYGS